MATNAFTALVSAFMMKDVELARMAAGEMAETPKEDRPEQMREFAEVLNAHVIEENDMAGMLLMLAMDQVDWAEVVHHVVDASFRKSEPRFTCKQARRG